MDFEASFSILQARASGAHSSSSGSADADSSSVAAAEATSTSCPCCAAAATSMRITEEESSALTPAPTEEYISTLSALELLNLVTLLQGERVQVYLGFNASLEALLNQEGEEVDVSVAYPLLVQETTALFSVISNKIKFVKTRLEASEETGLVHVAQIVQQLQEQEREKLLLTAARHLDLLQLHTSLKLPLHHLATPDAVHKEKIGTLEVAINSLLEEMQACKCDLL